MGINIKKGVFLIVIIVFFGCSEDIQQIENPEQVTTIEILSEVDSTYQVSVVDDVVYLVQDGKVVYQLRQDPDVKNANIIVNIVFFSILLITSVFVSIFLLVALIEVLS